MLSFMEDYNPAVSLALAEYWTGRDEQAAKQIASGNIDAGTRGAVTGGGHLDSISSLIRRVARSAVPTGVTVHSVKDENGLKVKGATTETYIPGYFRASKSWDIVYKREGIPVALIELKSIASSFGNNMNNRSEEAIGSAVDLKAAKEKGLLPESFWNGYVFVMADTPESRSRVAVQGAASLHTDPVFDGASYLDRATILCRRLVEQQLYNAAWMVATTRPPYFGWSEPEPHLTGFDEFASKLLTALPNL
jgi:hypothetical protein